MRLACMRKELDQDLSRKVDKEELVALDVKLGKQVGALETAILKGLKAISDKVRGGRNVFPLYVCCSSCTYNLLPPLIPTLVLCHALTHRTCEHAHASTAGVGRPG